jgi:hypothetical protein
MEKGFLRKRIIEPYFLERETPYSKRRPLKLKSLYWTGAIGTILFMIGVIFFGGKAQRKEANPTQPNYSIRPNLSSNNNAAGAGSINANPGSPFQSEYSGRSPNMGHSMGGGFGAPRNRSANQVIRRGEGGTDPSGKLPLGFGILVKLLNTVLSTDNGTPIIAEVGEDVFPQGGTGNGVSIPSSTRVIGNASYDDASHRIQVRFHTLVYPEGEQHGVQGMGLMQDGSAGLSGDYHSGEGTRQIGKFLGNFLGGFANGMKDRTTGGFAGIPYEPGSVKNGVLNGIGQSLSDDSKDFSTNLSQAKPTMTLPAGLQFILYLEHEYMP